MPKQHIDPTPELPARFADLEMPFAQLVQSAIDGIQASPALGDPVLGRHADDSKIFRNAPNAEGVLIEEGLALVLAACDRFALLRNLKLPITKLALAAARGVEESKLQTLGFDAEQYAVRHFCADLVLIDQQTDSGFLNEIKRQASNYAGDRFTRLRENVLAAGLSLQDFLWREHGRLVCKSVKIVILDAANEDKRPEVTRIGDFDTLLGTDGIAASIGYLRHLFRLEIGRVLDARQTERDVVLAAESELAAMFAEDGDAREPDPADDDEAPGTPPPLNVSFAGLGR